MKIGELAEQTGLAPSRIRFYERIGLLKPALRQANGYRSYPADAVMALKLIATGQQAGFSLDELRALLPKNLVEWEHDALLDTLQRKIADIELMQERLSESKLQLQTLVAQIKDKPQDMDCATNAKRVLAGLSIT